LWRSVTLGLGDRRNGDKRQRRQAGQDRSHGASPLVFPRPLAEQYRDPMAAVNPSRGEHRLGGPAWVDYEQGTWTEI
ncbi:MAG TPA: hypothetical protein VJP88_10020, partial [Caulobacteraceae bacterium]|nr:hypothetical protein [Caulobacteraceae bacterium]